MCLWKMHDETFSKYHLILWIYLGEKIFGPCIVSLEYKMHI